MTHFLLDGRNVVSEVQNGAVTTDYLRGINLISREANDTTEYYLYNAHGDVVNLVNADGTVTHSYDYDAFGNEVSPSDMDTNPFRYCGEYWDAETGTYYLRARYYAPDIGRFTQLDTHWNTANSIYGDNPQAINQREDKLGLKAYTHVPQITAVMQSGNLYVYGIGNPNLYVEGSGELALEAIAVFVAANPQIAVLAGTAVLGGLLYLGHETVELFEQAMNSKEWKQLEAAIQSATSNSAAASPGAPDPDDDKYKSPEGGGGVTDSIRVGNKQIDFGHGGRHLEGSGLSAKEVNQAIAKDVVNHHATGGQFYKGQISVGGKIIEYTSFGLSDEIINVGTYYIVG